jgi:hypothetical protein
MVWYKKALKKYKKEIVTSATFLIIFALALLLWNFWLGKSFVWQKIEPLNAPSFFDRAFYSALVFVSVGAFLYLIKFYKFLHFLIVRQLRSWELYKSTKKFIWILLILGMYGIFSKIVDFFNSIISLIYNILGLVLYALPSLGISLAISIPLFIILKKAEAKH